MALFIGSLVITILCCLAMGIGLLVRGRPLTGGCGANLLKGGRCADCPHRASVSDADETQ